MVENRESLTQSTEHSGRKRALGYVAFHNEILARGGLYNAATQMKFAGYPNLMALVEVD
jgi:hypothetical protein